MVDKLADIGGTMGLLTGFSFISFVEILYYGVKILLGIIQGRKGETQSPPSPPSPALLERAESHRNRDLAITEEQSEKIKFTLKDDPDLGREDIKTEIQHLHKVEEVLI